MSSNLELTEITSNENIDSSSFAIATLASGASGVITEKHTDDDEDIEEGAHVASVANTNFRYRALTFSPDFPENAPTVLAWKDVTVSVKYGSDEGKKKILLHNISGTITGGFWAIMGSSGGGKTTLLSTLSLRIDRTKIDVEGEITLNGRSYDKHDLKEMSAYVMQDDLIHPDLTVEETLDFTAKLRLPKSFSSEARNERIIEVMGLVGISHVRNVIVGDSRRKGISGGERKRLCVAMELLSSPALLFLDEPTSGLDSTTALSVCGVLKNLADKGICTVICTIHQPQQKIFDLFDNLILMKKGTIVYQGAAQKSLRLLQAVGLPCPQGINPADYLLDVISSKMDSSDRLAELVGTVPINLKIGELKPKFEIKEGKSWLTQTSILFTRNIKQQLRRYDIIIINIIVTVLISIFISMGVWHDIGTTQASIPLRLPSLFFACVTQGIIASLQATHSFPLERALALRERAAGTYYVSAYFVAKTISDTLFQLIGPIIFSIIVYPTIGYQPKASKFFIYMMFMILDTMAATSLATMLSCICVSIELTTVVMSVCFEISRLFGGFFISPAQITDYPAWHFADALSYIKYCYVGIALNELNGLELSCTASQVSSGQCISSGQEIIVEMGYDEYSIGYNVGILIVYIFGCRLFAYLALRFFKK